MTEHTPTPWKVAEASGEDGSLRIFSLSDALIAPANAYGDTPQQMKANAEFIVRACNSHAELLEALRELLDASFGNNISPEILPLAQDKARVAISGGTGG